MEIKKNIEKVPGGMMVVPLLLGTIINTFFPQILDIGGFTSAIARDGSLPLIGVFLVCMGAGIRLKAAPKALAKGASITVSKFVIGVALGLLIANLFGDQGLYGLSALAIIAGMTNTNGGLYAALTGEFGDETDVGAIAIISINDGPFLTMLALGTAGIATIPLLDLVAVILPIGVGMALGNLDPKMREFLSNGGPMLIPFFAFALGAGLHFNQVIEAGIMGVLLGVLTTFFGGIFNVLADKASGGTGVAGAASSSTAGNAAATPESVAMVDPSLQAAATTATPLVAASVLTTALLTPVFTNMVYRRVHGKTPEKPPEPQENG